MTKARELSDYTGLQGDLALKSPIASPSFTGNVGVTGTNAAVNVICGGVTEDSNLNFVQGSTTEGGITFDHNSGYASEQMNFRVGNNTTHMSINGAGIVTKPNQPAFSVYRNSGAANSSLGANGVIVCNGEHFDTGGNHNTSTGRFTAPVAGKYMISSFHMSTNDATYDNKNYTVNVNGSIYKEVYGSSGDAVHHQFNWSGIIQLAANDYVTLNYQNFNIYGSHANYSTFSGHLIG